MKNNSSIFVGWDIGGAHLKLAILDSSSNVLYVQQFATPIWKGLLYLENQIDWVLVNILDNYNQSELIHSITMTAELCDYFDSREEGVSRICQLVTDKLLNHESYFYAADKTFVLKDNIGAVINTLASSNWHATASFVARHYNDGLLVDMGSTTTDVIPFKNKQLINQGSSDHQRLGANELIYTGLVRTPIIAIANYVYYKQKRCNLMAEYFATMADVYRVLDLLNENADQYDTADGRAKTKFHSMCRLRRMIGLDFPDNKKNEEDTIKLAIYLSDIQAEIIVSAVQDIMQKNFSEQKAIIVHAGCGVDILSKMLKPTKYKQTSFENILKNKNIESYSLNTCATAISVAELLRLEYVN